MTASFVGIDVSKARLDVYLHPQGKRKSFSYEPQGIDTLKKWLARFSPERIVIEPTGKLEYLVVSELVQFPVSLVNPRQIRDFARAKGRLEKTDELDAQVLAEYGEAIKPPLTPVPSDEQKNIEGLVMRRRQLIDMRMAEKNRLSRAYLPVVQESIETVIHELSRQLDEVDQGIRDAYKASPEWERKVELLDGVSETTAAKMLALLPELGTLGHKQIAKLVGVAPLNRDSGTLRGKRAIRGGRSTVREALYMSALVGARHNPKIRAFYQSLRAKGKSGKIALVACMRKLVIIMNAMIKNNQPFHLTTA